MPVHDWKVVDAGLFHHFHQQWTGKICDALNTGILPKGYFALIEQKAIGVEPDVFTVTPHRQMDVSESMPQGGIALVDAPPQTLFSVRASDAIAYARKANRIGIRNKHGELVCAIELLSPGNKSSRRRLDKFVGKAVNFLLRGVHLLVLDLFPPTRRDPQGIHKRIWDEIEETPFELPPDKPLTLVSYIGAPSLEAFIEPIQVGLDLPEMPLFIAESTYVRVPLELTYMKTWELCPAEMKAFVLNPDR